MVQGDFLHRQNRTTMLGMGLGHLLQHARPARGASHQVIGQQNREWFMAHQGFGAQHRVAQTQGMRLAHVRANHISGLNTAHQLEQGAFTGGL